MLPAPSVDQRSDEPGESTRTTFLRKKVNPVAEPHQIQRKLTLDRRRRKPTVKKCPHSTRQQYRSFPEGSEDFAAIPEEKLLQVPLQDAYLINERSICAIADKSYN